MLVLFLIYWFLSHLIHLRLFFLILLSLNRFSFTREHLYCLIQVNFTSISLQLNIGVSRKIGTDWDTPKDRFLNKNTFCVGIIDFISYWLLQVLRQVNCFHFLVDDDLPWKTAFEITVLTDSEFIRKTHKVNFGNKKHGSLDTRIITLLSPMNIWKTKQPYLSIFGVWKIYLEINL